MAQAREIRTAPFGHPPRGVLGNENEVLNPGRYQYCAKSSTEYQGSGLSQLADPWVFVWWDELFATTDDSGELPEVPAVLEESQGFELEEESEGNPSWYLNRKNTWQSGPPVNNTIIDNPIEAAGYWTNKSGPNKIKDSASKDSGFQMSTKSDRPVMLYNMGHANVASQPGSAESNVIGWDGYLSFDDHDMGAPHAYSMYTLDMSPTLPKKLAQELKDWIEGQLGNGTYTPSTDEDITHVAPLLDGLSGQSRTLTLELVIRVFKMIVKIINQVNSEGIVGDKLINWDFIASLDNPTNANQYVYPPDQTVENPSAEQMDLYKFSGSGPHGKYRFSYTINNDILLPLFLMKMRANGMLWHLSSPEESNLRVRIMRVTNFAHIHGLGVLYDIDDRRNSKYRQVLSYWDKNMKAPDGALDKTRKLDTRG